MHRIWAVAENTLEEGLRQKVLLILVVFSIILLIASFFMTPFALGESRKLISDFGLGIASLLGVLTVIIIGSALIYKDIERRTIYTIVARPVRRLEIVIGKFLGLVILIAFLQLGMAVIQQIIIVVNEGKPTLALLANIPFELLEIMVLSGILLLFSSFSTPALSSIGAVIIFVIGHAAPDIKLFAEQTAAGFLKYLTLLVYYLLPNLENFNYRLELVHKLPLHADQIIFSICYGLIYTVFVLYVTTLVFERREFK
jgi:ABC-type transport system involved in multi-copper enzyme maturation permease subunit